MSLMNRTRDHELPPQSPPQSSPSMHQTPLYVLMTPELRSGNLLTLPGGNLLNGVRGGSTSILDNTSHIIRKNGIEFTAKSGGYVHDDESRPHGYAFLVEPAWHSNIPEYTDHTKENRWDMIPASPQPNPNAPLELHHWTSLLGRMQHINYRRKQLNEHRDEHDQLPLREAEEAFVRAFGRHIMRRTIR